MEKIQKKLISHLNPITVEQNYQQYKINKELKLKEKEKLIQNSEKEKYTFEPNKSKKQGNAKVDVSELSTSLFISNLKYLKASNSMANNFSKREKL